MTSADTLAGFRVPLVLFRILGLKKFRILALVLVCFALCGAGAAQEVDDDEVLNVRTDLVTVPVRVSDRKGRFVPDLTPANFIVKDDGRPVTIESFSAGVEQIKLAFVLDASGSVRDQIERQQQVSLALFNRFKQGSQVSVVHFREQPLTIGAWSADQDLITQAFQIPIIPERRTAIFDAVAYAARSYAALGRDKLERRIIVLITDGLDTASTTPPTVAINEALNQNVSVYVLHLPFFVPRNGRLRPRPPAKGLRELAARTGGRFYMIGDVRTALDPKAEPDFTSVFSDIADDLRSQYVLGFYPDRSRKSPISAERRISVQVVPEKKRKLRVNVLRNVYRLK